MRIPDIASKQVCTQFFHMIAAGIQPCRSRTLQASCQTLLTQLLSGTNGQGPYINHTKKLRQQTGLHSAFLYDCCMAEW